MKPVSDMSAPRGLNEDEKALKVQMLEALRQARTQMLRRHPFVGALAMRLKLLPVIDCRMTTACTDGYRIFFDAEFCQKMTDAQRQSVIAHEVWHCALRHASRRGDRQHYRFNYASDIEVDTLLKRDGFEVELLPHRPSWEEKTAESIYEELPPMAADIRNRDMHLSPDQAPPEEQGFPPPLDPSRDPDESSPKKKPPEGTLRDSDSTDRESDHQAKEIDGGKTTPANGNGVGNGTGNGIGNGAGNGNRSGYDGGATPYGSGDDGLSGLPGNGKSLRPSLPAIRHDLVFDPDFAPDFGDGNTVEKEWRTHVQEAYMRCKERGTLPAHIKKTLQSEVEPVVNWKKLLLEYVSLTIKGERNWLPPNRRFVHQKLYLPGYKRQERIDLVVALDTSGSTCGDLPQFLAELQEMTSKFGNYHITLIQCDCEIQSVKEYDNDSGPMDKELSFKGFGGTAFSPVFNYVDEKMATAPDVLIYLTDGYGENTAPEPDYPVIWCITLGGEASVGWGQIVKMAEQ